MRWGPARVVDRLEAERQPLPKMLGILRKAGAERFYGAGGNTCLGTEGAFHSVP